MRTNQTSSLIDCLKCGEPLKSISKRFIRRYINLQTWNYRLSQTWRTTQIYFKTIYKKLYKFVGLELGNFVVFNGLTEGCLVTPLVPPFRFTSEGIGASEGLQHSKAQSVYRDL